MYESRKNIRKKPLPTSSQSSSISHSTADSYAMISKSQLSEDNIITSSRSRALQYQASLKKLTYTTRPSKSETTSTSNKSSKSKHSTPPTARKQPLARQIKQEKVEEGPGSGAEEGEDDDLTFSKLKSAFMDVVDSSSTSIESKDDFIDTIKSQMDAQTIRIRRLERALKEKDDQLIKGDNESTVSLLLARYPHAMDLFQKKVEQDHYDHQIAICIDQFEDQKARMLEEYQRNFDMLKMKYRSRFDDIVERMISDPSRLDDEWARRVQQDADDRVEEFKRKMMGSSSNSHSNRKVYNHQ
ncbi:hypothetical protein V8B55DRAFT_1468879 [Mucor lusitanicus]|uniref:Uncharacterized protein n=2 Tax=Mucor circinelloides f. lusitanicus TaxID=29924 RepID=A0A162QCT9_MUCCL|nr:hypothetical protein FB192DRAFT_1405292 [Mucor lusitanicus]OAD00890.1 hypothetical protein MUCCIDRAFT_112310 [Mucor lusitanicus CBS 277.49]